MLKSRRLTNYKTHEEIVALAMLLGESGPFKCLSCNGAGGIGIFGLQHCHLCRGTGYHNVSEKLIKIIHGETE